MLIWEKVEKIIYRTTLGIWFSPLCKFILSCLNSKYFTFLFLDSLRPSWQRSLEKPTQSQVLFQRFIIGVLRNPRIFMSQFVKTLKVCVTYRCNLSCKACYTQGLQKEIPGDMKLSDFLQLVSWAKDKGWEKIRFLGGEPTIHPQFTEMLEICYRNHMSVTMPTNNLFSKQVLTKLDNPLVRDICINYNASMAVDEERKQMFRENIKQLNARRIPFSFSYILDYKDEDDCCMDILDDAKRYKAMYIRASLELPPFSEQSFSFEMSDETKSLFKKIYRMLEACVKYCIPFYIYRPVPLCIFSQEQQKELKFYSNYIFFTRCPISYLGQYGHSTMVTVNPDLSTFPCASVFIKGPNIFSFKSRYEIDRFYKESLKRLLSIPLMEICKNCNYHRRFLAAIKDTWLKKRNFDDFDDKEICQGGCMNFRCHTPLQYRCNLE